MSIKKAIIIPSKWSDQVTGALFILLCFMILIAINSTSMICYCDELDNIDICGIGADVEKNDEPKFSVSFSEYAERGEVKQIAALPNGMTAVSFRGRHINIYNEKAEYIYTADVGYSHSSYGMIWIDEKLYVFVNSNNRSDLNIISKDKAVECYDLESRDCQLIINELEKQNSVCVNPGHTTFIKNNSVIRKNADGSELMIYHNRTANFVLCVKRILFVIVIIYTSVFLYKFMKNTKTGLPQLRKKSFQDLEKNK